MFRKTCNRTTFRLNLKTIAEQVHDDYIITSNVSATEENVFWKNILHTSQTHIEKAHAENNTWFRHMQCARVR